MKKAFVSLFIVLFVLAFSACGKRTEEAKLSALGKNEALIPGAEPCCTAEEARKAGIPLSEVPFDTQVNEENGLESVTYSVENEKFSLELSGQEVEGGLFQFVNGKLSNITLNLSDGAACEAVRMGKTFPAAFRCLISGLKTGNGSAVKRILQWRMSSFYKSLSAPPLRNLPAAWRID